LQLGLVALPCVGDARSHRRGACASRVALVGFGLLPLCAFTMNPKGSDWRYVALACLIFASGAGAPHSANMCS
jgi:hypothetical protein